MNKWISVDSLMPNGDPFDRTYVWCYGGYDGSERFGFAGYYNGRIDRWFAVNNGDYVDGGYGNDYEAKVTHWMPLPAPPESE